MRVQAGVCIARILFLCIIAYLKQVLVVLLPTFDPLEVLEDRLNLDGPVHGCEFDRIGHKVEENLEIPVRVPIYEEKVVSIRLLELMRDHDLLGSQLAI